MNPQLPYLSRLRYQLIVPTSEDANENPNVFVCRAHNDAVNPCHRARVRNSKF
jgi:hypothetical protein